MSVRHPLADVRADITVDVSGQYPTTSSQADALLAAYGPRAYASSHWGPNVQHTWPPAPRCGFPRQRRRSNPSSTYATLAQILPVLANLLLPLSYAQWHEFLRDGPRQLDGPGCPLFRRPTNRPVNRALAGRFVCRSASRTFSGPLPAHAVHARRPRYPLRPVNWAKHHRLLRPPNKRPY